MTGAQMPFGVFLAYLCFSWIWAGVGVIEDVAHFLTRTWRSA
jgi:hypothetical protein